MLGEALGEALLYFSLGQMRQEMKPDDEAARQRGRWRVPARDTVNATSYRP